jgi:hypothetical protein
MNERQRHVRFGDGVFLEVGHGFVQILQRVVSLEGVFRHGLDNFSLSLLRDKEERAQQNDEQ